MSREIKFRGFATNENGKETIVVKGKEIKGDWAEGCYANTLDGGAVILTQETKGLARIWVDVLPETIGQYTGLHDNTKWEQLTEKEQFRFLEENKDKKFTNNDWNGKEIFEGDIYNSEVGNILHSVVWHDTSLIGKQQGRRFYEGLTYWCKRIEIIGTIFDKEAKL